ncbi:Fic family protein [Agromyces humi]|uniref:Fic family protein n=1 Tax=Agromyces humi TaxID=1766800 RepID=UPI0013584B36|nr:Fic family protein [Agromyces humi]
MYPDGEADWPPHAHETVRWQQTGRHGTREDRTLREITVALPPFIAELRYLPGAELTASINAATRDIIAVDADPRGHIRALGALLLRTESVASSRIEEVDASMDDYARAYAGIRANESATSMVAATKALGQMIDRAGQHGVIRLEDILDAHAILMAEDPIDRAYAGRLRDVQNWIGGSDHSPLRAVHVPPPAGTVEAYMADLIDFANRDDLDPITQASIAHAQFESIHPFTDGNGRVGRALINAIWRRRGVTRHTVVPVASAMLAERDRYFALVNAYRDGDVHEFIADVASGSAIAATESALSADRLARLPDEWREKSRPRAGSAAAKILSVLAEHPIISTEEAHELTGSPLSSVYTAMDRLEADGIIHQVTDRQRNRVWGATDILEELDDLAARIGGRVRDR